MDNLLKNTLRLSAYFALLSIVSFFAVTPRFAKALTAKPVGYWSFDDDIENRVDDGSANNNFGIISGGVTQNAGSLCVEEECVEFNGIDGKITVADSDALNFNATQNFSISLWIKTTITGNDARGVITKKNSDIGYRVYFAPTPDVGKIGLELISGESLTVLIEKQINDGKWHHVVFVIDRVNRKVFGYIDGSGPKEIPIPAGIGSLANSGNLFFGTNGSSNFFPGSIDELKLFNTVLVQGDVTALYQEGATGVGVSCSSNTDCTEKPGGHKSLECKKATSGKRCVPNPANRKIGTWCDAAEHCNTQEGILKLTCNTEKNMCVVASSGISCAEEEVNTEPLFGEVNQDIEPFDRCDRNSLFCNSKFICQADLGATSVEEISGIGRSTEDIRDTVRSIINTALGFLGVIGVIVTLYGGWIWMTAMGEEDKVEKAKKTIIAGIVGMIIIGVAWTIVSFVLTVTRGAGGG